MLKINAPFVSKDEVFPLIDAGADELYCGYLDPEWERHFTSLEFERKGSGSNFTDIKELAEAVDMAHSRGIPVSLAINGLYVQRQYPVLRRILKRLEHVAFDAYIVADMGLLRTLRDMQCRPKIHISTGATVFNSEASLFFREQGAARIVLDRQTRIKDMERLSRSVPDVEFEVFILNTLCVYIDGFCTFMHTYGPRSHSCGQEQGSVSGRDHLNVDSCFDLKVSADACCLAYDITAYDPELKNALGPDAAKPSFFKRSSDGIECGVCGLFDIARTRVASVKIVGRQYQASGRLADTAFVKKAIVLASDTALTRKEYISKVQEYYRSRYGYSQPCRGNNCYYPEVLV